MASAVAKFVGSRILKESAQNKFGQEDPYFEQIPATRLNGKPKTKKVKKRLPPGITEHDAKILNKVKRRAYRLDLALFNCCGIRFGWGAVIGIIPFVGDAIDLMLARSVIRTAQEIDGGLPKNVVSKMYMNAAIDFVIGFIPFLGDIADAVYKCNTRNAVLLEKVLRKRGKARLSGRDAEMEDPSLPDDFDREEEELNRRHGGPPPQYDRPAGQPSTSQAVPVQNNDRSSRGWFGGSGRQKPRDEEMAEPAPPPKPPRPQGRSTR